MDDKGANTPTLRDRASWRAWRRTCGEHGTFLARDRGDSCPQCVAEAVLRRADADADADADTFLLLDEAIQLLIAGTVGAVLVVFSMGIAAFVNSDEYRSETVATVLWLSYTGIAYLGFRAWKALNRDLGRKKKVNGHD